MKHGSLSVVLGRTSLRAFVAAPREINLLGMVRIGMEYGLLGIDRHGQYVRVNGSLVRSLHHKQVEDAIQMALSNRRPSQR
jgi:hypothetical protein